MKVFVTGGTGYLGRTILAALLARGHHVRALVRPKPGRRALPEAVEVCEGDVMDPSAVDRGIEGCDAAIHTASVVKFGDVYEAEILRVNVRGAEHLVQACARANVDRIVLTSSVAALGGTSEPSLLSERSSSTNAANAVSYSRSKLAAEVAARANCRTSTRLTILRPSVLLGPNDFSHSSAASFILPVLTGEMPVVVRGGASFGDVRDAALAHVAALEMTAPAPAYLLGGHNLTIAEIGKFVAERGGVRAPLRIPRRVAFVAAAMAERASKILGREPVLTKDLIRASAAFTFVDSSLAIADLRYRIRPLNESVLDTIAFFLQTKMLDPHNATLRALSTRSFADL